MYGGVEGEDGGEGRSEVGRGGWISYEVLWIITFQKIYYIDVV